MAMREDSHEFSDGPPADGEHNEEGQNWYFDVPTGAWERQEQKNRQLRQQVIDNLSDKKKPKAFGGNEKSGGGFLGLGKKSSDPGMRGFRENRSARQEPPATESRHGWGDDSEPEEPRPAGPLPLRRRNAAPPPPPVEDTADSEPKSRWDAMFGGPGELSIVDAMREWTQTGEARPRRVLGGPAQDEPASEPEFDTSAPAEPTQPKTDDDAAVSDFVARIRNRNLKRQEQPRPAEPEPFEAFVEPQPQGQDDERPVLEFPREPRRQQPEEPAADGGGDIVGAMRAWMRTGSAPTPDAPPADDRQSLSREPESFDDFARDDDAADGDFFPAEPPHRFSHEPVQPPSASRFASRQADPAPFENDEPAADAGGDIVSAMRMWATKGTAPKIDTPALVEDEPSFFAPEPAPPAFEQPEAPAAGDDDDIVSSMRMWATRGTAPKVDVPAPVEDEPAFAAPPPPPPAFEQERDEEAAGDGDSIVSAMRMWATKGAAPKADEPSLDAFVEPPAPVTPPAAEFSDEDPSDVPDEGNDIVSAMRAWATKSDTKPAPRRSFADHTTSSFDSRPDDDDDDSLSSMRGWASNKPAVDPFAGFDDDEPVAKQPARSSSKWNPTPVDTSDDDDWGAYEVPEDSEWQLAETVEPQKPTRTGPPPALAPATADSNPSEPLTLWASLDDDLAAVDDLEMEQRGGRRREEKKQGGGFFGKLFGKKNKKKEPEPETNAGDWLLPDDPGSLIAPKTSILSGEPGFASSDWLVDEDKAPPAPFAGDLVAVEEPWQPPAGRFSPIAQAPRQAAPSQSKDEEWTWESLADTPPAAPPQAEDGNDDWEALAQIAGGVQVEPAGPAPLAFTAPDEEPEQEFDFFASVGDDPGELPPATDVVADEPVAFVPAIVDDEPGDVAEPSFGYESTQASDVVEPSFDFDAEQPEDEYVVTPVATDLAEADDLEVAAPAEFLADAGPFATSTDEVEDEGVAFAVAEEVVFGTVEDAAFDGMDDDEVAFDFAGEDPLSAEVNEDVAIELADEAEFVAFVDEPVDEDDFDLEDAFAFVEDPDTAPMVESVSAVVIQVAEDEFEAVEDVNEFDAPAAFAPVDEPAEDEDSFPFEFAAEEQDEEPANSVGRASLVEVFEHEGANTVPLQDDEPHMTQQPDEGQRPFRASAWDDVPAGQDDEFTTATPDQPVNGAIDDDDEDGWNPDLAFLRPGPPPAPAPHGVVDDSPAPSPEPVAEHPFAAFEDAPKADDAFAVTTEPQTPAAAAFDDDDRWGAVLQSAESDEEQPPYVEPADWGQAPVDDAELTDEDQERWNAIVSAARYDEPVQGEADADAGSQFGLARFRQRPVQDDYEAPAAFQADEQPEPAASDRGEVGWRAWQPNLDDAPQEVYAEADEFADDGSDADDDFLQLAEGEDEHDIVLRAFEAHARQQVREPAAAGEAPNIFDFKDAQPDDFEELLGDDAAELVSEIGDRPVDERTSPNDVHGWAPHRTVDMEYEEPPSWARPAGSVSEVRENWRPTFGAAPDDELAPPWASAAVEPEEDSTDGRKRARSVVRELVETGLLALLVFLSVRASFQNFKVDGTSMYPTLENGQFLIVNKLVYSEVDLDKLSRFVPFVDPGDDPKRNVFHGPERGDIIVLKNPGNPDVDLIKRVIGLPGETVEIVQGHVYINGYLLDEPYIKTPWHDDRAAVTIPPGQYFVMGDNRDNSADSRSQQIGLIPEELIIGKAMLSYWPMSQFGLAPNKEGDISTTEGKPRVTAQRLEK